jgi:hypothetical protein
MSGFDRHEEEEEVVFSLRLYRFNVPGRFLFLKEA